MEQSSEVENSRTGRRDLGDGVVWLGGTLVLGSVLAPWVFNLILTIGRSGERFSAWREVEFQSVLSRCLLLVFLLGGLWFMRQRKLRWSGIPFLQGGDRGKEFLRGLLIGLATMGLAVGLGWVLGAYVPKEELARGLKKIPGALLGAMLIGLIEESLFRGMLFNALRKHCGAIFSVLMGSALFMVLHFAEAEPPRGTVVAHWYTGFEMLGHSFHLGHGLYHYWPYALTLFTMGALMCVLYEQKRNIFFIAGLHAGWVALMRSGSLCFSRENDVLPLLYGNGNVIAKTWMAFAVCAVFLAVVLFVRRKGQAEA